jgi:hypothetical protein
VPCGIFALISAIGKKLLQEWMQSEQQGRHHDGAIAVLDVGGINDGVLQQAQRVYQYVARLALDLLARIVAGGIVTPPFSALFTF